MMDDFARHYCSLLFRERFNNSRGDEFQRLFGQIMNLRYPGDFTQTKPWGSLGDDKCDGYLPSLRKFYQCYAPDDLEKGKTISKLKEDFAGALPHQGKYFDIWVFVHNARDGRIPSWLTFELENLRQAHPNVIIETLGYYELHQETFMLGREQLVDLFGPLAELRDVLAVNYDDIRPILHHVASNTIPEDLTPRPVPPQKIKYNQLSTDVEYCLKHGMIRADLVRNYLDRNPDKELSARVTKAFRDEYDKLKKYQLDPDSIFSGLRVFTQGQFAQHPRTEGAVFAVLAYLFEECDIFDSPLSS